jgi:hypothetical protein
MGWLWLFLLWPVGAFFVVAAVHGCRVLGERSRGAR